MSGRGSSDRARAQTTTLPSNSIQTVTTSGERVNCARRNIRVPRAQQTAAPSIQAMPAGRPLMRASFVPEQQGDGDGGADHRDAHARRDALAEKGSAEQHGEDGHGEAQDGGTPRGQLLHAKDGQRVPAQHVGQGQQWRWRPTPGRPATCVRRSARRRKTASPRPAAWWRPGNRAGSFPAARASSWASSRPT